ncbi:hypothetical protein [Nocardia terpenica]|uniref:hypothetical protein n=1 Tax=Nocardia terpenica TaxID=455432 RepID=UPI001C1DDCB1|nr:hypothetical protein [Nocardia terpenica]
MTRTNRCSAFATAFAVSIAGATILATTASSEPTPPGCTTDDSVSNQVTLACNPGSGNGTHAFIRCRDAGGLLHTRIGSPIGPDGGSSRAVCATGESGPA